LGEKLPSVVKGFRMNIWWLKRLLSGRTEILDVLTNKNAEYTLSEGFENNKMSHLDYKVKLVMNTENPTYPKEQAWQLS
jgi:hypothetical protein